jgi:hypothetical protein
VRNNDPANISLRNHNNLDPNGALYRLLRTQQRLDATVRKMHVENANKEPIDWHDYISTSTTPFMTVLVTLGLSWLKPTPLIDQWLTHFSNPNVRADPAPFIIHAHQWIEQQHAIQRSVAYKN